MNTGIGRDAATSQKMEKAKCKQEKGYLFVGSVAGAGLKSRLLYYTASRRPDIAS